MKITINLTEREVQHIYPAHDFYDCCSIVEDIMNKVLSEVQKQKRKKFGRRK